MPATLQHKPHSLLFVLSNIPMTDKLQQDQNRFFNYLLDQSEDALDLIVDDAKVGAQRRMGIYHNAYRASLKGVLEDHYERVKAYVGDAQFDAIALAFVKRNPSGFHNLRNYGAGFAEFLITGLTDDPDVGELAELDWKLRSAFDGPDAAPLDAARIGALGEQWIEAPLRLHPTASFMTATHDIIGLWSALENEETPSGADKLDAPVTILVWRKEMQSHFRSLSAEEAQALEKLSDGASFSEVSEFLIETLGEDEALKALSHWLSTWLGDGLLIESPAV